MKKLSVNILKGAIIAFLGVCLMQSAYVIAENYWRIYPALAESSGGITSIIQDPFYVDMDCDSGADSTYGIFYTDPIPVGDYRLFRFSGLCRTIQYTDTLAQASEWRDTIPGSAFSIIQPQTFDMPDSVIDIGTAVELADTGYFSIMDGSMTDTTSLRGMVRLKITLLDSSGGDLDTADFAWRYWWEMVGYGKR